VDDLVKSLGMSGVSKSQVSRLCGELDKRVDAFLGRQNRGRLALPVDRCPLRQDPRGRPHRRGIDEPASHGAERIANVDAWIVSDPSVVGLKRRVFS
jgi:hypothetical protein